MNFLLEEARESVWCEPNQDNWHVFKPWRISPKLGAIGRVVIAWFRLNLPTPSVDRYHVYNIGKIADIALGLKLTRGNWVKLSDLMVDNESLLDAYLTNGTIVPKDMCYLTVMQDYDVMLAVRVDNVDFGKYKYTEPFTTNVASLNYQITSQDLFIRFYHNMRFNTPEWVDVAGDAINPIRHISRRIVNLSDYTWFISTVADIVARFHGIGAGIYFKDGFIETLPQVYSIDLLGKTLSYTYDDSIKSIQFHKFNGLRQFDSTLDLGKSKYIILSNQDYGTIDYMDDVDFYIVSRDPATNRYRGVMLNRYSPNSVRMLTHNAWSINCDYVNSLINEHDMQVNINRVEIMVVVRQGAIIRGLVHQNNRIEELYKLPRAMRLAVMSGAISGIPEWHASALEASAYTKLMSAKITDIKMPLVMDAFGYNAVSLIGEPVIHVSADDSNQRIVNCSGALMLPNPQGTGDRTVFCYSDQRELLHYYGNDSLDTIEILPTPEADGTELVEIFHAKLDEAGDGTYFDSDVTSTDLGYWGYRCYVCPIVNGIPNEQWVDVTGGPYYTYTATPTPKVTWNWGLLSSANLFPALRINGVMHVYDQSMPASDTDYNGALKFTVGSSNEWFGSNMIRPMTLAPAVCDIFMDGRLLIRDLDYHMKWPEYTIVRRPLNEIQDTKITIRTYGCCDKETMLPYSAREVGFVKGGVLSVDGTYDIRNDRNVRINIAGRLYKREEVRFSENDTGATVTDGLPYIVEDYITPIEPYTGFDTVSERSKSFGLDERVRDFLTLHLNGNDPGDHTVVFERWRVFSPFLNAIIHEMIYGNTFNDTVLNIRFGNIEVEQWIQPYKDLLPFDPAVIGVDATYVVIYPHLYLAPVEVSTLQYTLLEYLIRNYLHNRIELSQSVNIGS